MSSPEKLFAPSRLKNLTKAERDQMQKELDGHLTPALRGIIRAHRLMRKELTDKLTPTLERFERAKTKR